MKFFQNKRRLIYVFLIPVLAGLAFSGFYFGSAVFYVKKIMVTSNRQGDRIFGLNELYSQSLIFLKTKDSQRKLTEANPQMKSLVLKKVWPDKLIITVEYYDSLVNFAADQGYFVLAENGQILYKTKEPKETLPLVKYYQRYSFDQYGSGDRLTNQDILSGLHFLTSLQGLSLQINSIDINGLNMIGFNLNNRKIIFTTAKDSQVQDYQLRAVVKQFKLEGRDFKTLDLRFDKPVVELN